MKKQIATYTGVFVMIAASSAIALAPTSIHDVIQAAAATVTGAITAGQIHLTSTGSTGDASTLSVTPNAKSNPSTLAAHLAGKQPLSPNLTGLASGRVELPSPKWSTYDKPYLPLHVNIGGYPDNALAGGTTVGTTHALTGSVTIPPTPGLDNKLAAFASGISGYARTLNSSTVQQGAVGVYGAGLCGASNSLCWGANLIVTNLADLSEPQAGKGNHNINMWGLEIDMNVRARPNGSAPGGNAHGLDFVGNSDVQPAGAFHAINIQSPGLYVNGYPGNYKGEGPLKWKEGIALRDGAAEHSLQVGRLNVLGASGSQPIQLLSRKPDGADLSAFVQTDQFGNILLTPAKGSNTVLTKADLSTGFSAGDAGIFINLDGTAKPVSLGSADSCGRGFKCLRVPN